MLSQTRALSLLSLLTLASALPAPVARPQYLSAYGAPGGGGIQCAILQQYRDVRNSEPYDDPAGWKQTGAQPVTSNSGPVTLSASNSVTYGITITTGFQLGIDFPKSVFDLALQFSVAWTKLTATGYTSGVSCPGGDYTCGMRSLARFVQITGTGYKIYDSEFSCTKAGSLGDDVLFTFQAPYLLGSDGNNQNPDITFAACICKTSKNQTEIPGLAPCPQDC